MIIEEITAPIPGHQPEPRVTRYELPSRFSVQCKAMAHDHVSVAVNGRMFSAPNVESLITQILETAGIISF